MQFRAFAQNSVPSLDHPNQNTKFSVRNPIVHLRTANLKKRRFYPSTQRNDVYKHRINDSKYSKYGTIILDSTRIQTIHIIKIRQHTSVLLLQGTLSILKVSVFLAMEQKNQMWFNYFILLLVYTTGFHTIEATECVICKWK